MYRARLLVTPLLMTVIAGCGGRMGEREATPWPRASHAYVVDSSNNRIVQIDELRDWHEFSAPLSNPCGITRDAMKRFYFAQAGNSVCRMDSMAGDGFVCFGASGTGPGQFVSPIGVAVDAAGRIYVVDARGNRIVRMDDMTGSGWATLGGPAAGSGPYQWDEPSGIAISSRGKILISDDNNGRIVEMDDLTGAGWQEWRGPHWGTSNASPYGVAYDDQSRIYTVEFGSSTIHRIDSIRGDGAVSFSGADLFQMSHVFVDATGAIWFTLLNAGNRIGVMRDMTGAGLEMFGVWGSEKGQFRNPCGIFAD